MVRWLYRQERLPEGIKANLYDLMNADVFTSMMPEAIIMKMDALNIHGNRAAHGGRIKAKDTYWLLKEAYLLGVFQIAKEFQEAVARDEALGLISDEIASYATLAGNKSAIRELCDDVLKKLAIEITL